MTDIQMNIIPKKKPLPEIEVERCWYDYFKEVAHRMGDPLNCVKITGCTREELLRPRKFDFGESDDAISFIIWSDQFVYIPHEYDGRYTVIAVPRNPCRLTYNIEGVGSYLSEEELDRVKPSIAQTKEYRPYGLDGRLDMTAEPVFLSGLMRTKAYGFEVIRNKENFDVHHSAIVTFLSQNISEVYPNVLSWFEETVAPTFKAGDINNPDRRIYLGLSNDNKIVGICITKVRAKKISTLFVIPEYRRNGCGKFLMHAAMRGLETTSPRIDIPYTEVNTYRAFIRRYGWVKFDTIDVDGTPTTRFNL